MKSLTPLFLSLLIALCACAEQNNAVNVAIDSELLKNLAGAKAGNSAEASETSPEASTTRPEEVVSIDNDTEQAIFQAIDDNANALNIQDLDAYWATLHPQSQFTALMPDAFYLLTTQYQTRYNILEKRIQSQSDNAAAVLVRRKTSDISGTLNQEILYTMRTDEGVWKIFFMTDQSTSF